MVTIFVNYILVTTQLIYSQIVWAGLLGYLHMNSYTIHFIFPNLLGYVVVSHVLIPVKYLISHTDVCCHLCSTGYITPTVQWLTDASGYCILE